MSDRFAFSGHGSLLEARTAARRPARFRQRWAPRPPSA
ncbi:hypothetical protein A33M_0854 [Rhodovulum sp. PH10]|nr:hypothetical protein A33M_0854 [Rhodovulum sp. PH10]